MCKNSPAVGGNIVPAVLMDNSRVFSGGVDAPTCLPASVRRAHKRRTDTRPRSKTMTSVFITFTSFLCFSCGKEVTLWSLPEKLCILLFPFHNFRQYISEQFRVDVLIRFENPAGLGDFYFICEEKKLWTR